MFRPACLPNRHRQSARSKVKRKSSVTINWRSAPAGFIRTVSIRRKWTKFVSAGENSDAVAWRLLMLWPLCWSSIGRSDCGGKLIRRAIWSVFTASMVQRGSALTARSSVVAGRWRYGRRATTMPLLSQKQKLLGWDCCRDHLLPLGSGGGRMKQAKLPTEWPSHRGAGKYE